MDRRCPGRSRLDYGKGNAASLPDLSIYGAIREQMNELERLEIDCKLVPGVSSFRASAAALRTELTAPEISPTIILTRISGRTPMPEPKNREPWHEPSPRSAYFCRSTR